jgi:hypothetical protein
MCVLCKRIVVFGSLGVVYGALGRCLQALSWLVRFPGLICVINMFQACGIKRNDALKMLQSEGLLIEIGYLA